MKPLTEGCVKGAGVNQVPTVAKPNNPPPPQKKRSGTEKRLEEAERLLRKILPDWADEVEHADFQVCCELTNREVCEIRDFLKNKSED